MTGNQWAIEQRYKFQASTNANIFHVGLRTLTRTMTHKGVGLGLTITHLVSVNIFCTSTNGVDFHSF